MSTRCRENGLRGALVETLLAGVSVSLGSDRMRLRKLLKRFLRLFPAVRRYLAKNQPITDALNETVTARDHLAAAASRFGAEVERLKSVQAALVSERDAVAAERNMVLSRLEKQPDADGRIKELDKSEALLGQQLKAALVRSEELNRCIDVQFNELISAIKSGKDLESAEVRTHCELVERFMAFRGYDKIGGHREIGKALFARSPRLYSGEGIPEHLRRYTYPAFISIALNSHCNAACFFCRESDFKGASIDFDQIFKLENAVRYARVIDLTGWGEPFFYPRFEEVVDFICSKNRGSQVIQVTSNGSFLSERWGKMLRGKLARLVISLNAATPDTYNEQMRYKNDRFTLEKVLGSIREFQAQVTDEDRSRIILHMVANTGNFREIPDFVRLAKSLSIPTVSVGNYICADEAHFDKILWHVKEEYNSSLSQARNLGNALGVGVWGRSFFVEEKEARGADNCMAPFEQFFIEMPGTTAPCCFMGAERMGNVYKDGFEAVWFSDLMNQLRESRSLPPCKVCTVYTPFDNKISHMSAFLTTEKGMEVLAEQTKRASREPAN
jgi:MoaA/NifB/PqqE/SkfB family radical SAM enzyme